MMERLFELISDNLGMLVIVGGFLLTFLAKLRKEGGNGQNRQQRPKANPMMPSFGGDAPRAERRWPQASSPQQDTSEPASRVQTQTSVARSADERDRWRDSHSNLSSPLSAPKANDSGTSSSGIGGSGLLGEDEQGETVLSASEAMRGMMWAEILGAPRAKKPFGMKNR